MSQHIYRFIFRDMFLHKRFEKFEQFLWGYETNKEERPWEYVCIHQWYDTTLYEKVEILRNLFEWGWWGCVSGVVRNKEQKDRIKDR